MQQHAFLGPQGIAKNRLRQIRGGYRRLSQIDFDLSAAGSGFSFDSILITSWQNQQTSFGAGMLDCRAHERINQLLQHDLTRHSLRDLDDGREIN